MHSLQPPRDDDRCGWAAGLPPQPPAREVSGTQRADCAVVGAGFTGLAISRRLAEHRPQWRVVLLEAQRVGSGASGRNSGFVVDVGHYEPSLGVEGNRRLARLGRAGLAQLRALVDEHAIECQWSEGGRLHGAVGGAGSRALERFLAGLDALGEPHERLDAKRMAAITGSEHYRAGARTRGGALMQPAALVRGLAAHLPASVELYEASPVRAIRRNSSFTLEAGRGTIVADRLFLATNGYTPGLGFLSRRIFPLVTFASLTRALDDREQGALGGEREWGLVCEDPLGATVRRTADQRILIRNTTRYGRGAASGERVLRAVRERHVRSLCARFPVLEGVGFEHTWGGVLGISLNTKPFFGRLAGELFAAVGFNGVGVALGTIAGTLLADLAVGAASPLLEDLRALPPPAWLPPEPILGVAVRSVLTFRQAWARREL